MLPDITSQKVAIPAALFGAQPRCSLDHRRAFSQVHKRKDLPNGHYVPRARVLPRLQSHREGDGSRFDEDRFDRHNHSLLGAQPRSPLDYSPRFWRSSPIRTNEHSCGVHPCDRFRCDLRAFASSISSILLNRRMKYLVLGPASMGIYSLIGSLKALESKLIDVKEISGSSAGSILALLLALGMSVDEILEVSLSLNIPDFVKLRIGSFFNKFGFVDLGPIREKLVEVCGCDPTFDELEMKIYVSAYCLNSSSTEYFSKDTHPNMKVIDAVCMSMAIPLIFACGKYEGRPI